MSSLSKFEAAIITIPQDLLAVLIQYASEQAFIWTGSEPIDRPAYYIEQGRQLQRFREIAWDKELSRNRSAI